MQLNITIEVWKKEKWFVARCPELDFVSQGKTRDEARNNLLEVIEIQFEEMADYLAECGYEKRTDMFVPLYKKNRPGRNGSTPAKVVKDAIRKAEAKLDEAETRTVHRDAVRARDYLRGMRTERSLARSGELNFLIKAIEKRGLK
ncbi:type II toxin-antitoxin system HicB family antitoxin [Desulfobacterales bacterium HSG2]|nr:type II toxin-antitoxin system HicB family antitoxin [Desulfobacterales bacterium HSG2]